MKARPFHERLGFALSGIVSTLRGEASFRFQALAAVGVFAVTAFVGAEPVWWALLTLVVAAVLSAELLNTALEHLIDRMHPERHPAIKLAKDCAAGAVLVLSLASVAIFVAFLAAHRTVLATLFDAVRRIPQ